MVSWKSHPKRQFATAKWQIPLWRDEEVDEDDDEDDEVDAKDDDDNDDT